MPAAQRDQFSSEEVAAQVAAVAADVDAVAHRAARSLDRLRSLEATPNVLLAARTTVDGAALAALRRDALLRDGDQQRLL